MLILSKKMSFVESLSPGIKYFISRLKLLTARAALLQVAAETKSIVLVSAIKNELFKYFRAQCSLYKILRFQEADVEKF